MCSVLSQFFLRERTRHVFPWIYKVHARPSWLNEA